MVIECLYLSHVITPVHPEQSMFCPVCRGFGAVCYVYIEEDFLTGGEKLDLLTYSLYVEFSL